MTDWIINLFARKYRDMDENSARQYLGEFSGRVGIIANLLLFSIKLAAGILSSSVAVIADAFNNLSDAGSAIVTLVGFHLASAPPDKEHPFGHGRMEYISAMAISVIIMLAGYELAKTSIKKIISPDDTTFGVLPFIIILTAIIVKIWLMVFYTRVGKKINSEALFASAVDSRNDAICTSLVVISAAVSIFAKISIDGYVGTAIAAFVMWSGISVLKDTVSLLLGQAPDPELVKSIRETVLGYDKIIGLHDLIVHSYGPTKRIISFHAEVSCEEDLMRSHDLIDRIERDLMGKYNAVVCIHMDPVDTKDERIKEMKALVEGIIKEVDSSVSLHDFRVVFGETHTNLIFDMVVPFHYKEKDINILRERVQKLVWETDPNLYTVVTVENSYA
ncbi:MAG TPA: cation transporter [Clostridiales bacterium]|nr:cation transporter [Clostridiales bacterium]